MHAKSPPKPQTLDTLPEPRISDTRASSLNGIHVSGHISYTVSYTSNPIFTINAPESRYNLINPFKIPILILEALYGRLSKLGSLFGYPKQ